MSIKVKIAIAAIALAASSAVAQTTWYVRADGGTRYSTAKPLGQCNGQANAPYPGTGVNQLCAFDDIRYLWADGEYAHGAGFPQWGWVGQGGDTYIIDCPNDCRIGYEGSGASSVVNVDHYDVAIPGDPYGSGMPAPPNGTATQHTRVLGANFASCTSDTAKAHLNGGYGVYPVVSLAGASYVDFACFIITDHSSCTRGSQNQCNTGYPLDDYATAGIAWKNTTNNVTVTDVNIHGMASTGMIGPPGDHVALERVVIAGNAGSGWNMDNGSGTTGTGLLTMDNVHILWNGCGEEYPIGHALPYVYCTDDQNGGYGDGIGTTTMPSSPPWTIVITNSEAAYNTQDGFDLLHVNGSGSSVTIENSLAYSNMGNQMKVGVSGVMRGNQIVGNCNALKQNIPGSIAGYNTHLSDFCRAGDVAVALVVADGQTTYYQNNTMLTDGTIGVQVSCANPCPVGALINYENNLFLGFPNPTSLTGILPAELWASAPNVWTNPGSIESNNLTWNAKYGCPTSEINPVCADPLLTDETYHLYGYGDMSLLPNSPAVAAGVPIQKPNIGAIQ